MADTVPEPPVSGDSPQLALMGRYAGFVALLLIILLPSLLLVKAFYDRGQGHVWQIDIAGFDPRDPLRGHYLDFTYDWNFIDTGQGGECSDAGPCCLCLTRSTPDSFSAPMVRGMQCNAPEREFCDSAVTSGTGNTTPLDRQVYFVPQDHARMLEDILRVNAHRAQMEIAVPPAGGPAIIRKLYFDGIPLEEFLRQNRHQNPHE